MKSIYKKILAGVMVFAFVFGLGGATHASASATSTKPNTQTTLLANIKDKADQEIARRIDILTKAIASINSSKKLTADEMTALSGEAQKNIDDLNTLKTKIDADTDVTTARTDRQSITKLYRIFMLVVPQIQVMAAADRINVTAGLLADVGTKLQTSITAAQTAGKDVTALNTSYTDMQAKIADAKTQADNAIAKVKALVPDQGNKTVMASNVAALKAARDMLKTARADLVAARKDAGDIRDGLKALGM